MDVRSNNSATFGTWFADEADSSANHQMELKASKLLVGDSGHAVVDFADRIKAGLVVIPWHGRNGVSRAARVRS